MSIELKYRADNFDNSAKFAFEYLNYRKEVSRGEGYIFYDSREDQIYLMQCPASIQSHYSEAQRAHIDRIYRGEEVVRNGDIVSVEGKSYSVKILGNYSDAGRLMPV
jgi:hypothetical protein